MIFGLLISSTVAGALITKFGRWKIYLVAGAIVMTIGMLLLSTIDANTSVLMLSVYMAVLGVGVGMLMQNLALAAQMLEVIQDIYGTATADLLLVGAPTALLAVIAVVFIREKPLSTLSGDERRAQEEAATGLPLH